MALLLSQNKMIDWLTKQISNHESPNKVIKKSEEELGRENIRDYIRKNDGRIHYIDDVTTPVARLWSRSESVDAGRLELR